MTLVAQGLNTISTRFSCDVFPFLMYNSLTYVLQLLRSREAHGAESDTNLVKLRAYIDIYTYIHFLLSGPHMWGHSL